MKLQRDTIKRQLVDEWGYQDSQAEETAQRLFALDSQIFDAFAIWVNTGQFANSPQYSDWTPQKLRLAYPFFKSPAVFLLLDWIRREPKQALFALEQEFGKSA